MLQLSAMVGELMSETVDTDIVDVWRGFLFAHAKVVRALEVDLLNEHDLPITWFDLLSRLKQAPDQRLRMHELEEAEASNRKAPWVR